MKFSKDHILSEIKRTTAANGGAPLGTSRFYAETGIKETDWRGRFWLTDNPVRAFRNAVAHASWRYLDDYSGLEFWARKGSSRDEPEVRWEVSQNDKSFWQALARVTAYSVLLSV